MNSESRHIKIVSGLSGAGKSIALGALEDLDYFCVDNLPIGMLPTFLDEMMLSEDDYVSRAAVSIDARNSRFLDLLPEALEYIENSALSYDVIFLEADDENLIRRYSETQRPHPLARDAEALADTIKREKELLAPLNKRATKYFDTTHMSPHELRSLIKEDAAGSRASQNSLLVFESFGYKRGTPVDADFVFDVRCLPNPYWVPNLKKFNGSEPPVIEYFSNHPEVADMIEQIESFILKWNPSFTKTGRVRMTVAIGCTGGFHRSVYVVEKLAENFAKRGINVHKRHGALNLKT